MKIEVSKLDAARRQLETAIRLFFYDVDFVSVHTLAAAAFNVINDLSRKAGEDKKSIQDKMLSYIRDNKKKLFLNGLRKTENFVKHADKDAGQTHTFDHRITTIFLIDAVICYFSLTGEYTILMQAYYLWYMVENPGHFIVPEEYREMLSMGSKLVKGTPKSMFLEVLLPSLLKRGII